MSVAPVTLNWNPKGEPLARLLVVDDSPDMVELVGRVLSRRGYHVLGVSNGNDAVATADVAQPAVILLDIGMPGVDGLDVLSRLRERASTSKIPVLMLTGHGEETTVRQAMALGAQGYLVKPFKTDDLVARVRRLLQLR